MTYRPTQPNRHRSTMSKLRKNSAIRAFNKGKLRMFMVSYEGKSEFVGSGGNIGECSLCLITDRANEPINGKILQKK